MKKINSIHFGGKLLGIGLMLAIFFPLMVKWITGTFSWWFLLPGGIVLILWLILFIIEMRQDFGKVPYYRIHIFEAG